jgi:hypothetical protein
LFIVSLKAALALFTVVTTQNVDIKCLCTYPQKTTFYGSGRIPIAQLPVPLTQHRGPCQLFNSITMNDTKLEEGKEYYCTWPNGVSRWVRVAAVGPKKSWVGWITIRPTMSGYRKKESHSESVPNDWITSTVMTEGEKYECTWPDGRKYQVRAVSVGQKKSNVEYFILKGVMGPKELQRESVPNEWLSPSRTWVERASKSDDEWAEFDPSSRSGCIGFVMLPLGTIILYLFH